MKIGSKIFVVVMLISAMLFAGVEYTMRVESYQPDEEKPFVTEAVVSVEAPSSFRVDITKQDLPLFWGPGDYILSPDGNMVYIVKPSQKTYTPFDMQDMIKSLGSLGKAMEGVMKISIEDPSVLSKRGDQDQTIAGYPAKHYILESSYTMRMKVLMMKMKSKVKTVKDLWVTDKVSLPVKDFYQQKNFKTGFEALDRLMEMEEKNVKGFILKSIALTTTVSRGKTSQTKDIFEVLSIKEKSFGKSFFEIPKDYQETSLVQEEEQGENTQKKEEGKGWKGFLKKFKKGE